MFCGQYSLWKIKQSQKTSNIKHEIGDVGSMPLLPKRELRWSHLLCLSLRFFISQMWDQIAQFPYGSEGMTSFPPRCKGSCFPYHHLIMMYAFEYFQYSARAHVGRIIF